MHLSPGYDVGRHPQTRVADAQIPSSSSLSCEFFQSLDQSLYINFAFGIAFSLDRNLCCSVRAERDALEPDCWLLMDALRE